MKRKAHTIIPGDKINGKTVFDMARQAFRGGYFIPFEDGTRLNIPSLETVITCD